MHVDWLCTCGSVVIDIKVYGIIGISKIEFFFLKLKSLKEICDISADILLKYDNVFRNNWNKLIYSVPDSFLNTLFGFLLARIYGRLLQLSRTFLWQKNLNPWQKLSFPKRFGSDEFDFRFEPGQSTAFLLPSFCQRVRLKFNLVLWKEDMTPCTRRKVSKKPFFIGNISVSHTGKSNINYSLDLKSVKRRDFLFANVSGCQSTN